IASYKFELKHRVIASFEAQLRAERGDYPPQLVALCNSILWDAGSGRPFLFSTHSSLTYLHVPNNVALQKTINKS
ncbi:MAG: hypothetical protein WCW00_05055, partial [Candidatus Paceibacterota bacterium]